MVIHVYSSYDIIKLAAMTLSLFHFVKIFVGNFSRRWFLIFSHAAVYFTAIRLADLILYFIPSEKYTIIINPLQQVCDMLLCAVLLLILGRVSKKVKAPEPVNPVIAAESDNG